jgi:exodeoxyribonuclease VII large subunit
LVVPQQSALQERLFGALRMLTRAAETRVDRERLKLAQRTRRLRDPRPTLGRSQAALHGLEKRLSRAAAAQRTRARLLLDAAERNLGALSPRARLAQQQILLTRLQGRLLASRRAWLVPHAATLAGLARRVGARGPAQLAGLRQRLAQAAIKLDAISPLRVLSRGYAIALLARTGQAVLRASDLSPGDRLHLRLHEGDVRVDVVE